MAQPTHHRFHVTVDVALLTLHEGALHALVVRRDQEPYAGRLALPGGFVRPDEDLEDAARRELQAETGLAGRLVLDQLRTFGRPGRDPRDRVVSVAYLGVVPEAEEASLGEVVAGDDAREAGWSPVSELLAPGAPADELAFDHAEILGAARRRLAGRIQYTAIAASLLPDEFTLAELRGVYEDIWGTRLDPGNFQRKMRAAGDYVEPTGRFRAASGGRGRPAELFRAVKSGTELLASPMPAPPA